MVTLSPMDWGLALAGGLLIGLAAAGLMLTYGRVAGVSGLVRNALGGRLEAVAFVIGLPLGALLVQVVAGGGAAVAFASPGRLALAGLLVGVGAGLANGCTSGHSVCGIARLSPRSLVATVLFIAVGAVMVALVGVPNP
ncbi:YeeE/YedE family protein [Paramagnetospirillum magneticum]|uniref:Predicted transporter component n=1 Tax=Paramagnetospirillum magneticum (strain ATCC 700264 / AMB-1) TaxID=342108 RepID=Q2W1W3_PARM1|nr:YeeE/YedE thiosulfate transporter family protein [Paramagnetospirillum magneticum]BAE52162.1 Predicted transporter component [Paramagnetospirillum magneticum AMB-1]